MRILFTLAVCCMLVLATYAAPRHRHRYGWGPNDPIHGQLEIDLCPGNRMVYCYFNPCQFSSCPGHPDAVCKPNYCGGCNTKYYEGETKSLVSYTPGFSDMAFLDSNIHLSNRIYVRVYSPASNNSN
ncbi:hypothetical protein ScPMuIL_007812 [Solemya velum]